MNFATYFLHEFLSKLADETDDPNTQFQADLILDDIRTAFAPPTPDIVKITPKPQATINRPGTRKNNTRFSSFDELISYFEKPLKVNNNSVMVMCPCHADRKQSLEITRGTKRYMLKCYAGCNYRDIWRAVGIQDRDFTLDDGTPRREINYPAFTPTPKQPTTPQPYNPDDFFHYTYYSLDGKAAGTKHRHKTNKRIMRWFNYAVNTIYTPDLERLMDADTIYYVEGEKDAVTLHQNGLAAFTCGGANEWADACAKWTQGKNLIIFSDNDAPGIECAKQVYNSCKAIARSVKVIIPTPNMVKGDITDFIENGGNIAELLRG